MDAKKLIVGLVAVFVLFYLITEPTQSANTVHQVLGWLRDAAESLIVFIKQLFA